MFDALLLSALLSAFPGAAHAGWFSWGAPAAPQAALTVVPRGAVEVRTASGEWQSITGPTKLSAEDQVRTKDGAAAMIVMSDGSKMALDANTEFSVENISSKETNLKLGAGKLKAVIAGLFASRLNIHTPTAVCAVRGTEFELDASQEHTQASVAEGHLEVSDTHGHTAVVTSEETLSVGSQGMEQPHMVSLHDERALSAVRPLSVNRELLNDRSRALVEELRNRELKANEAQLGKDAIDAFGNRVRIEEYALRPAKNQFELLFLTIRSATFNYGHFLETFHTTLPNDFSQISSIVVNTFLSPTAPSNWLTNMEFFATNQVDSEKETIALGDPIAINMAGFGLGTRYYPSSVDWKQFVSGPGVTGGTRQLFEQTQDFNSTTPGLFTWTQSIVNNAGAVAQLNKFQLNPSDGFDASNGGCSPGEICFDYSPAAINSMNGGSAATCLASNGCLPQAQFAAFNTVITFPSGSGKADRLLTTTYGDGTTLSSEKIWVDQKGSILDFANPPASIYNNTGSYNLEIVVGSNLFQGRKIDILIAPEILNQRSRSTTTADQL